MRCKYREVRTVSGEYMDVDIFPIMQQRYKQAGRSKRFKPTSGTMERYNQRRREKRLERLVLANFADTGVFFNPTYAPEHYPDTEDQAKRNISNFVRRLKQFRRKHGLSELKYIIKTEKGKRSGRLHHHMIINCADMAIADLEQIWGLGFSYFSRVQFDSEGCPGLAKYFCKNTKGKEEENDHGADVGNAWSRSRNLTEPKVSKNDSKVSKRMAVELCKLGNDGREAFEKLYPGFSFSCAHTLYNELNGGYYIAARLVKKRRDKNGRAGKRIPA